MPTSSSEHKSDNDLLDSAQVEKVNTRFDYPRMCCSVVDGSLRLKYTDTLSYLGSYFDTTLPVVHTHIAMHIPHAHVDLIAAILSRSLDQHHVLTLYTPLWTSAQWYVSLLPRLSDIPLVLSHSPPAQPAASRRWVTCAWKLGTPAECSAFRGFLRTCSKRHLLRLLHQLCNGNMLPAALECDVQKLAQDLLVLAHSPMGQRAPLQASILQTSTLSAPVLQRPQLHSVTTSIVAGDDTKEWIAAEHLRPQRQSGFVEPPPPAYSQKAPSQTKSTRPATVTDLLLTVPLLLDTCEPDRPTDPTHVWLGTPACSAELEMRNGVSHDPMYLYERRAMRTVLHQFAFTVLGDIGDRVEDIPPDRLEHRIPLTGMPTKKPPLRQRSLAKRLIYDQAMMRVINAKWVEPGPTQGSMFENPLLLVDNNTRITGDFRHVNQFTQVDVMYEDAADFIYSATLPNHVWKSKADVAKGYYKMFIHPDDRYKTAFTHNKTCWQWRIMAPGLSGAQNSFNRAFGHDVADLSWAVFRDDCYASHHDFMAHLDQVYQLLKRCEEKRWRLNKKSIFGAFELIVVGRKLTKDKILPDPAQVSALADAHLPATTTEMRSFLGLANQSRKFVKDFGTIAQPLTAQTGGAKRTPLVWSHEQITAFNRLKCSIAQAALEGLAYMDPYKPFHVIHDASNVGMGATLRQVNDKGELVIIAYFSKAFTPAQRNYAAYQREALAHIAAMEQWMHWLDNNQPIYVYCDNKAIELLQTSDNPMVVRWRHKIAHLPIQHKWVRRVHTKVEDHLAKYPHQPADSISDTPELPPAAWTAPILAFVVFGPRT